jgi:hypothetical protein
MISKLARIGRLVLLAIFSSSYLLNSAKSFTVQPKSVSRRTTTTTTTTTTVFLAKKRRNPLRSIKNIFKKPKTSANFPLEGKKVKLTTERAAELAKKYETIETVEEHAYHVLLDLELVQPTKS